MLWSVTAARRTDTAFDRLLADTDAWDVLVNPDAGDQTTRSRRTALRVLPMVGDASRMQGLMAFEASFDTWPEIDQAPLVFGTDGGAGDRFARPRLREGRLPSVDADDEVYLDELAAAQLGVRVGDSIQLRFVTGAKRGESPATGAWRRGRPRPLVRRSGCHRAAGHDGDGRRHVARGLRGRRAASHLPMMLVSPPLLGTASQGFGASGGTTS